MPWFMFGIYCLITGSNESVDYGHFILHVFMGLLIGRLYLLLLHKVIYTPNSL